MRWSLPTAAALIAASPAVLADEPIRQTNNQESYSIAIAPLHVTEQTNPLQGPPVIDSVAGTRYLYGYEVARTRAIFTVPGWYTDFDVSAGGATLLDTGSQFESGVTGPVPLNESVTYGEESVRGRVGRTFEFARNGIFAVTPFVGLSEKFWVREAPVNDNASGYMYADGGVEGGILAQASLPWHLVLGASAAAGRTTGALVHGEALERNYASTKSYSLKLDHRTIPDWHQSLEVRQIFRHYSLAPDVPSFFEPSRASELSVMLEVGWEFPAP
jgi:hypothetical protein